MLNVRSVSFFLLDGALLMTPFEWHRYRQRTRLQRWPPRAVYPLACALALLAPVQSSMATNGLTLPGVSLDQTAMAGAGAALLSSSASTLRDPAAGAFMERGYELTLTIALPRAHYAASAPGDDSRLSIFEFAPGDYRSVYETALAPAVALHWRLNDRWAWGLGLYGGGLGTTMPDGAARIARGFPLINSQCAGDFGGGRAQDGSAALDQCGDAKTFSGVRATQIFASAHLSLRASQSLGFGVAPVVAAQQLEISGLAAFDPYSVSPGRVTDNGGAYAYGAGLRVGAQWRPTPGFGVSAAYQSRIQQSPLDEYRGILPGGNFDIPAQWHVAVEVALSARTRLYADVEGIQYEQVEALARAPDLAAFVNRCLVPRLVGGGQSGAADAAFCLGGERGPGFGWSNNRIYKLGIRHRAGRWHWMAGYSSGGNPIETPHAILTTLAPAIVDRHIAFGLSWDWSQQLRIGAALSYSPQTRVTARNRLSNVTLRAGSGAGAMSDTPSQAGLVGVTVEEDPHDQLVENRFEILQLQVGLTWRPG